VYYMCGMEHDLLREGHALLRRHGLWLGDETHSYAYARALSLLPPGYAHAEAVATALQALYEAHRLVTPRSSLEGQRILLGDYFLSVAVDLSLPLGNPALTSLVAAEMSAIGAGASRVFGGGAAARRAFDRFIEDFCHAAAA